VSEELIYTGHEDVTRTVLANKGAQLDDLLLDYLLEEYCEVPSVLEDLVYRGGLPVRIAEKLFSVVSDQLKKQLTRKYKLTRQLADDITENARETAVLQFIAPWMSEQDIQGLVDQMHKSKRLSYSVVIRSLCIGDLRFFEMALAKMAGVPLHNARILLSDPGALGFNALYDSTPMPTSFRDAAHILFRLALEVTEYGKYHREDFAERMIDRIMAKGYEQKIENMPYLVSIIGRSMRDVPGIH